MVVISGILWYSLGKLLPVLIFTCAAPRRVSASSREKKRVSRKSFEFESKSGMKNREKGSR